LKIKEETNISGKDLQGRKLADLYVSEVEKDYIDFEDRLMLNMSTEDDIDSNDLLKIEKAYDAMTKNIDHLYKSFFIDSGIKLDLYGTYDVSGFEYWFREGFLDIYISIGKKDNNNIPLTDISLNNSDIRMIESEVSNITMKIEGIVNDFTRTANQYDGINFYYNDFV
jgi:hypothetical protein